MEEGDWMDDIRQLVRQKVINLKADKGVTYAYMAKQAGDPVTRWDIAHLVKNNTKMGRRKLDKLKEFILNY